MMRVLGLAVLVSVLAIAACSSGDGGSGGNGDDDILHLRGGDITRDAYRDYIRREFLGPLRGICGGLQGLSAEEIVDAVLATQEGTPEPLDAVGTTPVAGQEPDTDSRLAAAEIIGQECERVAVAEATPTPEPPAEPTATPEPTEPPALSSDLKLGDTATTAIGNTLTVYSYEVPVVAEFFEPDPGNAFAAIDVEGCAKADLEAPASINPFDFELQMPDNTRRQADIGVREPSLNDTTLFAGDCVRGFVTFQVPAGVTPTVVIFETFDADFNPIVIKWTVQ